MGDSHAGLPGSGIKSTPRHRVALTPKDKERTKGTKLSTLFDTFSEKTKPAVLSDDEEAGERRYEAISQSAEKKLEEKRRREEEEKKSKSGKPVRPISVRSSSFPHSTNKRHLLMPLLPFSYLAFCLLLSLRLRLRLCLRLLLLPLMLHRHSHSRLLQFLRLQSPYHRSPLPFQRANPHLVFSLVRRQQQQALLHHSQAHQP